MSNRQNHLVKVLVWCVIATIPVWLTIGVAKMWPYNDVSFPQGNVGTVEPGKVREGGTIFVTFPEYCNTGQVVTFRRWADLYVRGVRVASDEVSAITFYPQPGRPDCVENDTQEIPLSDQFRAYGERPTTYRIRFEAVYGPNPLRVVTVPSSTDLFTVLPATSPPIR
jgi:hypothetical protein